jgi:hypothetical protein
MNANNRVLNFYINKYIGSRLLNKFSSLVMQTPIFLTKLTDESIIFIINFGKNVIHTYIIIIVIIFFYNE